MATSNAIRALNRLPFNFVDGLKVKGVDLEDYVTGPSATNLTTTVTATTVNINSSTGGDASIPAATSTEAGVMSAADKVKLSGIDLTAKQDTLVSGTNIKTLNGESILGSGDIVVDVGASSAADVTFSPVGNLAATNVQAAVAELDTEKQTTLVSGTNIKTINNLSILGSGNIDIASGAATAASVTFTPTGNISATNVQLALVELDSEKQSTLVSGTSIKTINSSSLLGAGDVVLQAPLVSGTTIKTINTNSLLGSGNLSVQDTLVSGTNIKTINNTSILGSGNINISGGAATATATDVTFTPSGGLSSTNVQTALVELDSEKQPTLVSGTNIKTINNVPLLGSGNLSIVAALPWIIFTSTSNRSAPANVETVIDDWTTSASGGASDIALSSGRIFTLPAGTWNVSISVGTTLAAGTTSFAKFHTGTPNANTTIIASSSHNPSQSLLYGVTAGSGIINISAPTMFYCSIMGTGAVSANSDNFANRISIQKINT